MPRRTAARAISRSSPNARFIVCHDTQECFVPSPSDYRWDFSGFEHVWTYTQFPTYTTVVSNSEPIPLEHLDGRAGLP
jgi:hypothetical protein